MTHPLPVFDDLLVSDALPMLLIGETVDDCNAAARALLASGTKSLCGQSLATMLPAVQPDGSDSLEAWAQRVEAARSGLPQWFLWQFVRHDGKLVDALVHLEAAAPEGGTSDDTPANGTTAGAPARNARLRARLRDLTQFRGVEWSRMQQALAGSAAMVFAKDLEGRYLFVNRAFARMLGRTPEDVVGSLDIDVLPGALARNARRQDAMVLEQRHPLDFEEQAEVEGEPRSYLTLKFPLMRADGSAYGAWGISTDITTRKRTQQALHDAALAVSRADEEGLVQALTRYVATILGTDLALIGVIEGEGDERRVRTIGMYGDGIYLENHEYLLSSTPCRTVLEGFRCYRQNVLEAFPDSNRMRKARIESYAGYPLRGSDGRLLGVIAVLSRRPIEDEALAESVLGIFAGRAAGEIERRLAEQALRESEEQYRSIFNASVDGLLLWDSAGRVVDVNEAFVRMHGFELDDLLGADCERFVPEERREHCKRMVREALAGTAGSVKSIARRRDGTTFDIEVHLVPMQYRNEPHVLAIVRDLTESRREEARRAQLEEQLRQAQKMEAIGHLTGGIAHDFNNLLASIMGYVVLASERQENLGDARLGQYLEQARLSCERARDLIRQMLTFSRGQRGEPRPIGLPAAVREATKLLRASFPATVEMTTEFEVDLPAVMMDPVQFEQMLMNLCINARDAMHSSGTVRVHAVSRYGLRAVCTSCRQSVEGDFVELSIGDTGPGIADDVIDRIFEPFFSTKEVGKGSGMGLATVHGIVHDHHGHIVVDSQSGRGAVFRVLLPPLGTALAEGPRAAPAAASAVDRPRLSGRVVLVDDEASVLGFMRELLENWGLRVSPFFDPEEARRQITSDGFEFDMLIADQTMPRLTGTELARAVAPARPEVPILLYTGYRDGVAASELEAGGIRAVLDKPVDASTLYAQVRRYLPQRRARG